MSRICAKYEAAVEALQAELDNIGELMAHANSQEKKALLAKQKLVLQQLTQANKELQTCLKTQKIPAGEWNINANNFTGTLFLQNPDSQGNVEGTIYNSNINGFWDAPSGRLIFFRMDGDLGTTQVFTGYLFMGSNPAVMAGSFEAFAGTGATGARSVFGWFATWQHF